MVDPLNTSWLDPYMPKAFAGVIGGASSTAPVLEEEEDEPDSSWLDPFTPGPPDFSDVAGSASSTAPRPGWEGAIPTAEMDTSSNLALDTAAGNFQTAQVVPRALAAGTLELGATLGHAVEGATSGNVLDAITSGLANIPRAAGAGWGNIPAPVEIAPILGMAQEAQQQQMAEQVAAMPPAQPGPQGPMDLLKSELGTVNQFAGLGADAFQEAANQIAPPPAGTFSERLASPRAVETVLGSAARSAPGMALSMATTAGVGPAAGLASIAAQEYGGADPGADLEHQQAALLALPAKVLLEKVGLAQTMKSLGVRASTAAKVAQGIKAMVTEAGTEGLQDGVDQLAEQMTYSQEKGWDVDRFLESAVAGGILGLGGSVASQQAAGSGAQDGPETAQRGAGGAPEARLGGSLGAPEPGLGGTQAALAPPTGGTDAPAEPPPGVTYAPDAEGQQQLATVDVPEAEVGPVEPESEEGIPESKALISALDTVKARESEVTFDVRDYSEAQKLAIVEAARRRGLSAADSGNWILVRDLRGIEGAADEVVPETEPGVDTRPLLVQQRLREAAQQEAVPAPDRRVEDRPVPLITDRRKMEADRRQESVPVAVDRRARLEAADKAGDVATVQQIEREEFPGFIDGGRNLLEGPLAKGANNIPELFPLETRKPTKWTATKSGDEPYHLERPDKSAVTMDASERFWLAGAPKRAKSWRQQGWMRGFQQHFEEEATGLEAGIAAGTPIETAGWTGTGKEQRIALSDGSSIDARVFDYINTRHPDAQFVKVEGQEKLAVVEDGKLIGGVRPEAPRKAPADDDDSFDFGANLFGAPMPEEVTVGAGGGNLVSALVSDPRAPLSSVSRLSSADAEVEKRWRAAHGIKLPGKLARLKEAAVLAQRSFRRAHIDLDPKASPEFARADDIIRLHGATDHYSKLLARDAIDSVTKSLTPEHGDLLERLLALPDIQRDIEAGLYEGKELPFGYADAAALKTDLDTFRAEAEKKPNKAVRDALAQREKVRKFVVRQLVSAGVLPEGALEDPRYYHRQVMAYMEREQSRAGVGASTIRTGRKGFQVQRAGGGDFNTFYQEAEFEWLSDAIQVIEKKKTQALLKDNSDISAELKLRAKLELGEPARWRELIPETHVAWKPKEGTSLFTANSITERTIEKLLAGDKEFEASDVRKVLAARPSEEWIIPKELAATLDGMESRQEALPERAWVMAQNSWKQWTLLNPLRAARYNLNNFSGDLDIAVAAEGTKILRRIPPNFNDLWHYYIKRNATSAVTERVQKLVKLGVLDSGLTIEEIPDINKAGVLRSMSETSMVPRYWNRVKQYTTFRENLLRGAAYDFYLDSWARGVKRYGASTPAEIDAQADPEKRAAKLARELIGDYGDISVSGRWIRRRLIPFYSWLEINAPRYVRMMRNEAIANTGGSKGSALNKAGGVILKKAAGTGAKQVVKYGVRANILLAAIAAYNHFVWPEEEEELGDARREPHIILGRNPDTGEIRSFRFQGALADALDWLSLSDVVADAGELASGAKTAGAQVAEAVKAPIEKVVVGWEPFSKTLFEAATGRSIYPRVFEEGESFKLSPRTIYDRAQHVAGVFSLRQVYDAVTRKPRRKGSKADVALDAIVYRTDPGEAAYFSTRQRVNDFLRKQGEDTSFGFEKNERQLALYYYKKASQWQDEENAKYWLKQYFELGGSAEGMAKSIEKSAPLGMLKQEYRDAFIASLNPQQRKALAVASRWYEKRMGD